MLGGSGNVLRSEESRNLQIPTVKCQRCMRWGWEWSAYTVGAPTETVEDGICSPSPIEWNSSRTDRKMSLDRGLGINSMKFYKSPLSLLREVLR